MFFGSGRQGAGGKINEHLHRVTAKSSLHPTYPPTHPPPPIEVIAVLNKYGGGGGGEELSLTTPPIISDTLVTGIPPPTTLLSHSGCLESLVRESWLITPTLLSLP